MPKVDISEELGQTIKELRSKRNINATEVAKAINKSVGYISNIENTKIKSIDISDLLGIFEYLIPNENERDEIVSELFKTLSVRYTAKELKDKEWFEVYDKQYRLLSIPLEFVDFLKESLTKLNMSSDDLVESMNSNHGLEDEKLPYNKVISHCFPDGSTSLSIKFKIPSDYIQNILDKKVTKTNYITLQGIVYNINHLMGLSDKDSSDLAQKTLYNFKIYTSSELKKIMQDAKLQTSISNIPHEELIENTKLPKNAINNIKLLETLVQILRAMSDSDIDYLNSQLDSLNKNLIATPSFMINLLGIPFNKMKDIPQEKHKELFKQIRDLFNKFLEEQIQPSEPPKIEIEKF